jgi:hypothetical protein
MQLLYTPAPREIQFNCPWCTTRLALPEEDFNNERAVICPRCNNPVDLAVQRRIVESAPPEGPAPAQAPASAPAQAPASAPAQAPASAPAQGSPPLPSPTAPAQAPPITPPQAPPPVPPQAPPPQPAHPPDRQVSAPGGAAPQRRRREGAQRKQTPPPTSPAEPQPLPPLKKSLTKIAALDFDLEKSIDIDAAFESNEIHVDDISSLMTESDLLSTERTIRSGASDTTDPRTDRAMGLVECPSCKYENTPVLAGFEFGKVRTCTWCAKPLPE